MKNYKATATVCQQEDDQFDNRSLYIKDVEDEDQARKTAKIHWIECGCIIKGDINVKEL